MAFECSVFTHNCAYGGYELIVFVMSFDILSLEIVVHDDSSIALNFSFAFRQVDYEIRGFVLSTDYLTRQYLTSQFLHYSTKYTSQKKLASSHQVKFAQRLFELVGDETNEVRQRSFTLAKFARLSPLKTPK